MNLKDVMLLGRAHPRDAVRPKVKREARREDESTSPLDRGASTSNSSKIRVLNHKDYKTWKVRIGSIYAFSGITGLFGQSSQNNYLLMARPSKREMP